ncbi:MAG: hypothetical protein IGQ45_14425 [Cyanobacterium sp. T60_A2020_053]|nr:hypothetical protein [Cyanobacterium sp. T60_A2020_053]
MNKYQYIITETELARIKSIKDEDIDLSDNPETDENFWQSATLIRQSKSFKKNVLLDPDVAKIFTTDEAVNQALRLLINLAQAQVN